MRRLLVVIGLLLQLNFLFAQDIEVLKIEEIVVPDDTSQLFSLQDYVKIVLANHPVVKQADLLPESARQMLRMAKGAFDPKLSGSWDAKNYKDTEYYDIFNTTLKVPLWFPIDPKISVDRNRGVYLNPERLVPANEEFRQVTAGVSLPIGRGLFIDNRRAAVKQAELFGQINDAERIKMINKILFDAVKAYWDWYYAYFDYRLVNASLDISQEVYRRVRLDYEFGEVAVVDTVQAAITYQNRQSDRQLALIDFRKSSLMLSNYLWGENEEPLELQEQVVPMWDRVFELPEATMDSLFSAATTNHPELLKLGAKLGQLDVDERLAKENLKPRVDLNYNIINSPIDYDGDFVPFNVRDNYKFGIALEFPLFLRKERSKLKQTRLKIQETNYAVQYTRQQIVNDLEAAFFEVQNGQQVINVLSRNVNNYQRLLEAELLNLSIGESDLFKINFQQDKLLEAQIKLIKEQSVLEKAKAKLYWAAGLLYLAY